VPLNNQERIYAIKKTGKKARGRQELMLHLEGKPLTKLAAIKAKCYECMGFYIDGTVSCSLPHCPLYPWMPYRDIVAHMIPKEVVKTKRKPLK